MTAHEWAAIPDEELVRRAQRDPGGARGREAESQLFERHRDRLYAWCHHQTHDRERALDLVQNTMLAAHRGLRSFEGRAVDEITRLLGLDNQTGARALLQRARRKLRLARGDAKPS